MIRGVFKLDIGNDLGISSGIPMFLGFKVNVKVRVLKVRVGVNTNACSN